MRALFIFPAVIIFGCTTPLVVDVPKTTSLVVDGVFNPDSVWTVKLSLNQHILKSLPYKYSPELEEIPDNEIKTVTIRDENNALIESLQYTTQNIYREDAYNLTRNYIGQTKPQINKTYKLEIETNSYGTITGTGYLPPPVPVTSAEIEEGVSIKGDRVKKVTVEFSDDGNTANFYEIYILRYDNNVKGNPGEGTEVKYRAYYTVGFSINDPAYSEKVHNQSLVFDDTLFNGKQVKFSLEIKGSYSNIDQVVLRNITEDLYKLTVARQAQARNEENDNPFSEPVLVKGNIQNGYGIFSGFAYSKHKL